MKRHVASRVLTTTEIRDHHEPAGVRVRQRLEQDQIHRAKDCRRGADAERPYKYGDRSKAGLISQRANRIAEILQHVLQPTSTARVATVLFHLFRTAKSKPRLSSRFVRRAALCDQLVGVLFKMEAQFLLELFFHLPSAQEALPPIHSTTPSVSLRTSPTASVNRCQLAASVSNCARPFRVRR